MSLPSKNSQNREPKKLSVHLKNKRSLQSLSKEMAAHVKSELSDNTIDRTNDKEIVRPTIEAYEELERAFDFFNLHLFIQKFGVQLPHVMLTMPKSRRYQGYFQHDSWNTTRNECISASEIALNPQFFSSQVEVCQTLVHELVHLGQAEHPEIFGRPSPRGYHNKAFAKSMITIGLMPSTTGKPGGKTTGTSMSDYIIEGGPFASAYERFIRSGYEIRWSSMPLANSGQSFDGDKIEEEREQKKRSKTKYSCDVCHLNAWAKPQVKLAFVTCSRLMREDTGDRV